MRKNERKEVKKTTQGKERMQKCKLHPIPSRQGFPSGSECKESTCCAGGTRDMGLIPGLGRSLEEEGHSYPLQYSCLENFIDQESGGLQPIGWQRVGHDWVINTSARQIVHWMERATSDQGASFSGLVDETGSPRWKTVVQIKHWLRASP